MSIAAGTHDHAHALILDIPYHIISGHDVACQAVQDPIHVIISMNLLNITHIGL